MQTARQDSGQDAASADMAALCTAGLEVLRQPNLGSTWEHKALCEAAELMLQAHPQLCRAGQGPLPSVCQGAHQVLPG